MLLQHKGVDIMDLSKELAKISESEDGLSIVLAKLQKEQETIEKKKHILEIMQIVKKIKELVPTLLKENINYFVVSKRKYEKYQPLIQGYTLELSPKGSVPDQSISVRDNKSNFLPWFESIMKITEDFDLKYQYTEEFSEKEKYNPKTVDLNGDIENQFYDILLNKELRAALQYNQLHLKLNKTNKEKNKEVKPSKI